MNDYETDYETDEMESLSELVAGLESDELDELAERRRRRRERGVRTASTGSSLPPPTSSGVYVKKSDFARYVMTVDKKNEINTKAITTLNARANTLADQQAIQARAIKKQRRDLMKVATDARNTALVLASLPLILPAPTRAINATVTGTALVQGDQVLVQQADFLQKVIPLIAVFAVSYVGGLGGLGTGGSSGSSGSGSSGL